MTTCTVTVNYRSALGDHLDIANFQVSALAVYLANPIVTPDAVNFNVVDGGTFALVQGDKLRIRVTTWGTEWYVKVPAQTSIDLDELVLEHSITPASGLPVPLVPDSMQDLVTQAVGARDDAVGARDVSVAARDDAVAAKTAVEAVVATTDGLMTAVQADPTSQFALSQAATFARGLSVTDPRFGAVGDGVTDDTAAIQAALAVGGDIVLPAGTFLVSDELRVKSNTRVYGAGIGVTTVKMAEGVSQWLNVFTNAGNTRLAHSTYDGGIRIGDMTIDGSGFDRLSTGWQYDATSGCCVGFSTVEDSIIERVHAIHGYYHGIDVAASVYYDGPDPSVLAEGPSRNIVIRDCIAETPFMDDGITTHHSEKIRIERCKSIYVGTPLSNSQQGFEIDEGSRDVVLDTCYSSGWCKAFQVKGHDTSRAATRVELLHCIAENSNYGFEITHKRPSDLPFVSAKDVSLVDCHVLSTTLTFPTLYTELLALKISGYANVRVKGFSSRNSTNGSIWIINGAENVILEDIVFENTHTAPADPSLGMIHVPGASVIRGLTLRNIKSRTAAVAPVIRVNDATSTDLIIDRVQGTGSAATYGAVNLAQMVAGWLVSGIKSTGYLADISIDAGGFVGTYQTALAPAVAAALWKSATNAPSWGGVTNFIRRGEQVQVDMTGIVPIAGLTGATTETAATITWSYRPVRDTPVALVATDNTTLRGWISTGGLLRAAFVSGKVYHATVSYFVGG